MHLATSDIKYPLLCLLKGKVSVPCFLKEAVHHLNKSIYYFIDKRNNTNWPLLAAWDRSVREFETYVIREGCCRLQAAGCRL